MNLRAIVTMLRHVHGYQSYKNLRWSAVNFKPGLHAILRRWRQHGRKIAHTDELQDAYLNLCRFGEQFWLHASWDLLCSSLSEAYRVVKSMLHGAARSLRRTEMNTRTAPFGFSFVILNIYTRVLLASKLRIKMAKQG